MSLSERSTIELRKFQNFESCDRVDFAMESNISVKKKYIIVKLMGNLPNNLKRHWLNVQDNDSSIPLSFIFVISR